MNEKFIWWPLRRYMRCVPGYKDLQPVLSKRTLMLPTVALGYMYESSLSFVREEYLGLRRNEKWILCSCKAAVHMWARVNQEQTLDLSSWVLIDYWQGCCRTGREGGKGGLNCAWLGLAAWNSACSEGSFCPSLNVALVAVCLVETSYHLWRCL